MNSHYFEHNGYQHDQAYQSQAQYDLNYHNGYTQYQYADDDHMDGYSNNYEYQTGLYMTDQQMALLPTQSYHERYHTAANVNYNVDIPSYNNAATNEPYINQTATQISQQQHRYLRNNDMPLKYQIPPSHQHLFSFNGLISGGSNEAVQLHQQNTSQDELMSSKAGLLRETSCEQKQYQDQDQDQTYYQTQSESVDQDDLMTQGFFKRRKASEADVKSISETIRVASPQDSQNSDPIPDPQPVLSHRPTTNIIQTPTELSQTQQTISLLQYDHQTRYLLIRLLLTLSRSPIYPPPLTPLIESTQARLTSIFPSSQLQVIPFFNPVMTSSSQLIHSAALIWCDKWIIGIGCSRISLQDAVSKAKFNSLYLGDFVQRLEGELEFQDLTESESLGDFEMVWNTGDDTGRGFWSSVSFDRVYWLLRVHLYGIEKLYAQYLDQVKDCVDQLERDQIFLLDDIDKTHDLRQLCLKAQQFHKRAEFTKEIIPEPRLSLHLSTAQYQQKRTIAMQVSQFITLVSKLLTTSSTIPPLQRHLSDLSLQSQHLYDIQMTYGKSLMAVKEMFQPYRVMIHRLPNFKCTVKGHRLEGRVIHSAVLIFGDKILSVGATSTTDLTGDAENQGQFGDNRCVHLAAYNLIHHSDLFAHSGEFGFLSSVSRYGELSMNRLLFLIRKHIIGLKLAERNDTFHMLRFKPDVWNYTNLKSSLIRPVIRKSSDQPSKTLQALRSYQYLSSETNTHFKKLMKALLTQATLLETTVRKPAKFYLPQLNFTNASPYDIITSYYPSSRVEVSLLFKPIPQDQEMLYTAVMLLDDIPVSVSASLKSARHAQEMCCLLSIISQGILSSNGCHAFAKYVYPQADNEVPSLRKGLHVQKLINLVEFETSVLRQTVRRDIRIYDDEGVVAATTEVDKSRDEEVWDLETAQKRCLVGGQVKMSDEWFYWE